MIHYFCFIFLSIYNKLTSFVKLMKTRKEAEKWKEGSERGFARVKLTVRGEGVV